MPQMFLHYPPAEGAASANIKGEDYSGWIELGSVSVQSGRELESPLGVNVDERNTNAEGANAFVNEISVTTRSVQKHTPLLFKESLVGAPVTAKVHITGDVYPVKMELTNCLIKDYALEGDMEALTLSFTEIDYNQTIFKCNERKV